MWADTKDIKIDIELRQIISTKMAWQYRIVPCSKKSGCLVFYTDGEVPLSKMKDELEIILGERITFIELEKSVLNELLSTYYPRTKENNISVKVGSNNFVQELLKEARMLKSSDIHLEPYEHLCRVRIRIDGQLVERYTILKNEYPGIINKIKIMARLDISEKRLPQDGRIFFNHEEFKFDIRVSILPTLYGEKIVLRILNNDASDLELEEMGFSNIDLRNFKESILKPNGIILISGPTGSGKTTTLYATLKKLNSKSKNIVTIEDPIEYTLEGINQVQLKEDIGLDFTKSLKTFLRQDPDIIMVGEIRDMATAQMAIRAALTGHLVLSTIHTNTSWGIVTRLIDMGIPSYMVSNTLNLAVAQRLVRLLCNDCKIQVDFDPDILPKSFNPSTVPKFHYMAVGCEKCLYTGYKGRRAIFEVIPIKDKLREYIKSTKMNIEDYLNKNKIELISEQAFKLLANGETSIDETYSLLFQD